MCLTIKEVELSNEPSAHISDHRVVMLTMLQYHARVAACPCVGSPGPDMARCCVTQMSAWYEEKCPDISTHCPQQSKDI